MSEVAAPPAQAPAPGPVLASSYIVPAAAYTKRVRTIAADGQEEHADDNIWVHMQLKDPFQQQSASDDTATAAAAAEAAAAAAAGGDESAAAAKQEEVPKPEEVIKAFASAKGELDWLQSLLSTLQEGKYLTVGRSERPQGLQRLADLASAANTRFRRRAAAAASAAAALSEGASALAALGRKEDEFYEQVARLQRFWKVRQEPPDSPYAYSVNLNLAMPQQQQDSGGSSGGSDGSSSSSGAPDATAAMVGRGPVPVVYILKDPAGMLRVQVPAPKAAGPPTVMFKGVEEPPDVYTGPAAIHGLLLQQLRLNTWHMALSSLDAEIAHLLGLPARLQPSRMVLAAAAAAATAGKQRQQPMPVLPQTQLVHRQQSDASMGGAAGLISASSTASMQLGGGQQQQQQQPGQQQQQQQQLFAAGGHLTFFALLSSLVLQAVAGAAGTAGESAVLQQQQQQHRQQQQPPQHQQQHAATPGTGNGSLSEGLLLGEVDVGCPWEKAAAAAAAAVARDSSSDAGGVEAGSMLSDQTPAAAAGSNGSNGLVSQVFVDPQLLSLRPLALEHLLITQLGHLVPSLRLGFDSSAMMAAIAYAAAARQLFERARQRSEFLQQQQQQQLGGGSTKDDTAAGVGGTGQAATAGASAGGAAAAGSGSLRPGSYLFGGSVSFMTCLSRWLAHSCHRDMVRDRVDEVLANHAGIVARSLASSHSCVSAMKLARSPLPAAAAAAAGRQRPALLGTAAEVAAAAAVSTAAGAAAVAPSLLMLLTDTTTTLEGCCGASSEPQADGLAPSGGGVDGWQGSPLQNAVLTLQLQTVPNVLEQLLQQLE